MGERAEWYMAHLGPALRLLRHERELTLQDVCDRLSTSESQLHPTLVSSWERQIKEPNMRSVVRYLEALQLTLAELEEAMSRVAARRAEAGEAPLPQGALAKAPSLIRVPVWLDLDPEQLREWIHSEAGEMVGRVAASRLLHGVWKELKAERRRQPAPRDDSSGEEDSDDGFE